jgi:RNA polymerase sigma factor (sigma-70 family)
VTVSPEDPLAAAFEAERPRLRAVAYRMLGSASEAEDAVQEAWLRLERTGAEAIDNLGGWLTTVVARVALDLLKARNRRREDYVGSWLPEPVVGAAAGDPEREALLADAVGLALLVVLETLAPKERLAFVLHDMFAMPFAEIAPIIDASPDAARQLASRARRRVRGGTPEEAAGDPARQRALVDAFLAAAREGDFAALLQVLAPDVVFRQDSGGRPAGAAAATEPVVGAETVARTALAAGRPFLRLARPATVNGGPGLVIVAPGRAGERVIGVAGLTIAGDRIAAIDLVTDPAKLRDVRPYHQEP